MNASMRAVCIALVCALPVTTRAQSPTARIVRNANAFLATFEPAQKQRVLFAFDDQKQRVRWSNLPDRMVQRAGLSMGELSAAQRAAAMTLLASALSPRGFEKVQQIVQGREDDPARRTEGDVDERHRVLPHPGAGAAAAAVAALGWIGERAFGIANPVGPLVESAANHGPVLIAALAMMAVLAEWRVRFVPRIAPFVTRR